MTESRMEEGLPENWRERIAGKKVIFYNTSIGSMLVWKEKQIRKMKWIFELFQNETGVVLWWRPHPLEESTVKAKLPQLYSMYSEIRKNFQQDNIGILDESPEWERAIAISDAYYGTGSSLIHLYKETGKPVLVSNTGINEKSQEKLFAVNDFVVHENTMWFISLIYNSLFALEIDTMKIKKIFRIPCLYSFSTHTMLSVICQNDKVILIPNKAEHIVTYDIKQEKIFKSSRKNRDFFGFSKIYTKAGDYLYGVSWMNHYVSKYCISENTYEKIPVGKTESKYIGIKWVDGIFVLMQSGKEEVVLWNEETGEVEFITGFPENYMVWNREHSFADMVVIDNDVLVFPQYTNMILKIEVKNKIITQYADSFDDYSLEQGPLFRCAKIIGNKIYAFAYYKNRWTIYDIRKNTSEQAYINIEDKLYQELMEPSIFDTIKSDNKGGKGSFFYEGEDSNIFTLINYIDAVKKYDFIMEDSEQTKRENYGTLIFKELMQEQNML